MSKTLPLVHHERRAQAPLAGPRPRALSLVALWLATFTACLLANGTAGNWLRTAEGADFGVETTRTAAAILKYGEFRDPFVPMPTGPTAHVAPAYPVLYSGVVAVFGAGKGSWWAIRILTLAAYALGLSLLPWLAFELGLSRRVGVVGAVLGCLVPLPGSCYKWEALFTGLALVAMAYAAARLRHSKTLASAAFLGALAGVALLLSPVVVLVYLAWGVLIWRSLQPKSILLLAGIPVLIISPWLVRNYRVFGHWFFVRDAFGTELAVSNNDCASAWMLDNTHSGCFVKEHPNASRELDERIVGVGEYRFNAERFEAARSWISSHWREFVVLSSKRFLYFWFPAAAGGSGQLLLGTILVSLLTAASIPGLVLMYRENRFAAQMLTVCLLFFPLVHYLTHVELRYRFPILWVACMGSAYLFTRRSDGALLSRAQTGEA